MSAHAVKPAAHVWQPADDDRLAELWNEGLSSVQIAKRMACSKGSILGRAHRLLLKPRPNPSKHQPVSAAVAAARLRAMTDRLAREAARKPAQADQSIAASQHPTEPETPCAGNVVPPEAMSETTPWAANDNRNACQWPIGHPKRPGFRLCCASAEPSKPYCLVHCRTAYIGYRRAPCDPAQFLGTYKPWR